jgi:hypothetical protein
MKRLCFPILFFLPPRSATVKNSSKQKAAAATVAFANVELAPPQLAKRRPHCLLTHPITTTTTTAAFTPSSCTVTIIPILSAG